MMTGAARMHFILNYINGSRNVAFLFPHQAACHLLFECNCFEFCVILSITVWYMSPVKNNNNFKTALNAAEMI